MINVHDRFPVFQGEADGYIKAFIQGADGGIAADELVALFGEDGLQQGGDVLKVVVKGIAGDAAAVGDHADTDLMEGIFVQ